MREYVTDFHSKDVPSEQHVILICDAKKSPDGTITPREAIGATGLDYEERYQNTDGVPCVYATHATLYRGKVVCYGGGSSYKSDKSAIRYLVTRYGYNVIEEHTRDYSM